MLLSLLLIIMGFNMYVGAAAFKATAKTAQGEVLANRLYSNEEILPIRIRKTQAQSAETKRISGYQATVRFAIEGGEPVETMIPSGQEISPGDRLEVLYDPDKPTLALFKKDFSPWKEGALPLIPAVLVYGASLWGASLIRRKYKGK
ncbi:MAG: DUF3592 domain-containing protein [Deltaproteobacteria bacterium]|nr:DUF3592 domain-containing protein [Deltaproteobacteria bacterium]